MNKHQRNHSNDFIGYSTPPNYDGEAPSERDSKGPSHYETPDKPYFPPDDLDLTRF